MRTNPLEPEAPLRDPRRHEQLQRVLQFAVFPGIGYVENYLGQTVACDSSQYDERWAGTSDASTPSAVQPTTPLDRMAAMGALVRRLAIDDSYTLVLACFVATLTPAFEVRLRSAIDLLREALRDAPHKRPPRGGAPPGPAHANAVVTAPGAARSRRS